MEIKKQNYKMLVMDMDYTLLNNEKKISEGNRKAVRKAIEKGVHAVVATGRIYTSARVYARLLGVSTPIIASNGAIIREAVFGNPEDTERTIFRDILDGVAVREMIRLTRKSGLVCHFFTENTIYSEKLVNVSLRYTEWNKYLGEEDQVRIEIVDDIEETLFGGKVEILKAVVVDDNDEMIRRVRSGIESTGIVTASQSLKGNLEVMNKGVTKGNAVRILSEIYNIPREEIIAIGDNENDISMIEYAGMGIAMGNAEESLKNAADHITKDYMEDGVAAAIDKFIL